MPGTKRTVGTVAALVLTLVLPLPEASGSEPALPDGPVHVQSAVNGLNAADTGGEVHLHRPRGDEGRQRWRIAERSGGTSELRSTDAPARCLGRSSGQAVAVVACDHDDAAWLLVPSGGGTYTLDVPGGERRLVLADAPSGQVHPTRPQLTTGTGAGTRWYLTPVPLPVRPMPPAGERTLDQVTFLTTHNAYANGVDGGFAPPFANAFPNQSRGLRQQLDDGVRGFMLDVHQTPDGAVMCHGSCTLVSRPVALWVGVQRIVDHLRAHPGQFATVFLEDYVPATLLRSELARVDGLADVLYRPDREGVRTRGWPRMADLGGPGRQLLVFTDRTRGQDASAGLTRDSFGVMYQREWTVENHWSMGPGLGGSDWSCYSRWYGAGVNVPLTREEPGFRPLFVMNHFRDVPIAATISSDNAKLLNRAENFCAPAARKKPNFVAVDRYELGDAAAAVDSLNGYTVHP
ncbi:PI-PLC domain-containing protein [Streptomyces sp. 549]|uniref:PI-PLC domain-containing protein n=1 Tax=Streptomyces sp. 549 TaxID=3049076 RepID=UPI0024C31440|nr:PI-PLC domain-containing protein [Streptomyces sp. 549]MDK1473301.1 PI-PLC domain-containing protein [Streptomyces sp. 549]